MIKKPDKSPHPPSPRQLRALATARISKATEPMSRGQVVDGLRQMAHRRFGNDPQALEEMLRDIDTYSKMPPIEEIQRKAQELIDRMEAERKWSWTGITPPRKPSIAGGRPHVPNYVPFANRVLSAALALTWIGWAMIGLLSGHMFFLVSRAGPAHFSGVPALIFSAAVLASAVALASGIVDHYDRRNNEHVYWRVKKALWLLAGTLLLVCIAVAGLEHASLLPWTDGGLGLLSAPELQALLASDAVARVLGPHRESLFGWFGATFAWFIVGILVCKKAGWLTDDQAKIQRNPGRHFTLLLLLILPALISFTLALLAELSVVDTARARGLTDDRVRAQVAWMHSMFVASLGGLLFVLSIPLIAVLRMIGLIPSMQDEIKLAGPSNQDLSA